MRCPSATRLAAASIGSDPKALLHADLCERCGGELAAMAAVGELARRAPVRIASADRRARIAALVMATSDAAGPPKKSRMPLVAIVITGLAAIATLVAWRVQPERGQVVALPVLPRVAPPVVAAAPTVVRTPVVVAPPPVVEAPPVIPPPAPRVVRKPAASALSEFAGSQERAGSGDLAREQMTLEPPVVATPPFELGWTALREARYADAIAAFDRATDPAVAEDAAYWAAIATARSGDRAGAKQRLLDFLAKFPGTARRVDASALIDRL